MQRRKAGAGRGETCFVLHKKEAPGGKIAPQADKSERKTDCGIKKCAALGQCGNIKKGKREYGLQLLPRLYPEDKGEAA